MPPQSVRDRDPKTRPEIEVPNQVFGKRGGPANGGRRAWTAVGASLSQLPSVETGAPEGRSLTGSVWTRSESSAGSEEMACMAISITDRQRQSLATLHTSSNWREHASTRACACSLVSSVSLAADGSRQLRVQTLG